MLTRLKTESRIAIALALFAAAVPSAALAQTANAAVPKTFQDVVVNIIDILKLVLPLLVGLTILVIVWGVAKFLSRVGNEKSHEEGRNLLLWGVIGLFLMVTVWGLLSFLSHEIGGGDAAIQILPQ